ncbi:MAG: PEPxxWA-CTERM sorting domain-containing protein [Sandaracinobacteroides sp.]
MKIIIALLAFAATVPAFAGTNIVTNGGFETGDFSGWTQFGNTGFSGVEDSSFVDAPEGEFQAYFGSFGSSGGIFQRLSTVAGERYAISFDFYADAGGPQFFRANFGSVTLLSGRFRAGQDYTSYSFEAVAARPRTNLRFTARHDPGTYRLDNVSVSLVPEPATWTMLIAGFGLVGLASRRRTAGISA